MMLTYRGSLERSESGINKLAPVPAELKMPRARLPESQLHFHVGWFQNTGPAAKPTLGSIAVLRLDGD